MTTPGPGPSARTPPWPAHLFPPLIYLLFPTEIALSLLEKMQTQEILRILRLPELGDLGQFFRSLSATTLVSMGALAAILAYWLTHRPKALQPPCNLLMQSEEVEVSRAGTDPSYKVAPEARSQTCSLFDPKWSKESLVTSQYDSVAALCKISSKMVLEPLQHQRRCWYH